SSAWPIPDRPQADLRRYAAQPQRTTGASDRRAGNPVGARSQNTGVAQAVLDSALATCCNRVKKSRLRQRREETAIRVTGPGPGDAASGDGVGVRRGEGEAGAEQTGGRVGRGECEDGPTLVAEIAHDASLFSFSGRSGSR